jgi:hypothetical protein
MCVIQHLGENLVRVPDWAVRRISRENWLKRVCEMVRWRLSLPVSKPKAPGNGRLYCDSNEMRESKTVQNLVLNATIVIRVLISPTQNRMSICSIDI